MKACHLTLPVAFAALALPLTLVGCNKKADDQPKTAAGGELLPRSVGDDMLPYGTVKSQASLASPDAGLRPARMEDPSASASIAPVEDAEAPQEEVPVIEAAPPSASPVP